MSNSKGAKEKPRSGGARKSAREGEAAEKVARFEKLKSILVPVDFSPSSATSLAFAVSIARRFRARITLLHVTQAQFYATEFGHTPAAEMSLREGCTGRLRAFAEGKIDSELVADALVRSGVPFDEITKAAEELCVDLIVVSTRGQTGLKHVLMGSTAERVVQHATCPVLVIR
jgi:universal stress protein A